MFSSFRSKERKEGLKVIKDILESRSDVFSIHYSCESFNRPQSGTPRITSISIYNLFTGEHKSFSLHIESEKKGYNINNLSIVELDASERALLQKFYKFVKAHPRSIWVHWNMKNSKYGFDAIKDRYEIVTPNRKAPVIRIEDRYNLSSLLIKLYGPRYEICEQGSRLKSLSQRNHLALEGILKGEDEGRAYSRKDFHTIMASSQDKAEAIGLIMKAAGEKRLSVNSSFREIYGINGLGIILYIGDNFSRIKKIVLGISGLLGSIMTLWNLEIIKTLYNLIIHIF